MNMIIILLLAIAAILVIVGIIALIVSICRLPRGKRHDPAREAGRAGERIAAEILQESMREGDHYVRNVKVVSETGEAELDNLIINPYGVFLIEVKNYYGRIEGGEEDEQWLLLKESGDGKDYNKVIGNPFFQLQRQVEVTRQMLESFGIQAPVEGYLMFIQGNSPVESDQVLSDRIGIDLALHGRGSRLLKEETIEEISGILNLV